MQHYDDFEWILYRSGLLSKRMMEEMSDHLESCDACLERYLATLDVPVPVPAGRPAREPIHFQRNSTASRRMRWASAAALIFIFLAILMGITPQGQTVLAQIRNRLEDIGNTLTELFGLPEDSPYVQDIGQIQTVPHTIDSTAPDAQDIDIKLDQILVEKDKLTYAIIVSGNLPQDSDRVSFEENLTINDEAIRVWHGSNYRRMLPNVIIQYTTWNMEDFFREAGIYHFELSLSGLTFTDYSWTKKNRIKGSWVFEFDIDTHNLVENSAIYPIAKEFELDNLRYSIDELIINPIRQSLTVRKYDGHLLKPEPENWEKLAIFQLITDDGSEFLLTMKNLQSDKDGNTVYSFEIQDNAYEQLKNASSFQLVPYVTPSASNRVKFDLDGTEPLNDGMVTILRDPGIMVSESITILRKP